MNKKNIKRIIITSCSLLIGGSVVYGTMKYFDRVEQKQKEENKKQQKQIENKNKKTFDEQNKYADKEKGASTFINSSKHIYYQTDSIYGKLIKKSADNWNKALGYSLFIPAMTGQLTDLMITDINMPYSKEINNENSSIITPNSIVLNVSEPITQKYSDDEIILQIEQLMGRAIGLPDDSKLFLANHISPLKALENEKNLKKQIDNIYDNGKKNKTLHYCYLPVQSGLISKPINQYSWLTYVTPIALQNSTFKKNSQSYTTNFKSVQSDLKKNKGKIDDNKIYQLSNKYQQVLKKSKIKFYMADKKQIDNVQNKYAVQTGVVTVAGDESTLGVSLKGGDNK